jgi:hypothetical protein
VGLVHTGWTHIQEILTHGWDLAKATGQPTERDPELAFFALAGAKRILPPAATTITVITKDNG